MYTKNSMLFLEGSENEKKIIVFFPPFYCFDSERNKHLCLPSCVCMCTCVHIISYFLSFSAFKNKLFSTFLRQRRSSLISQPISFT